MAIFRHGTCRVCEQRMEEATMERLWREQARRGHRGRGPVRATNRPRMSDRTRARWQLLGVAACIAIIVIARWDTLKVQVPHDLSVGADVTVVLVTAALFVGWPFLILAALLGSIGRRRGR